MNVLLLILSFVWIASCSAPKKPVTGPAKPFEMNPIDFDPHAPVKQEVEVKEGEEEVFTLEADAFVPVHFITRWQNIDLKYKPLIFEFMEFHTGAVENWGKSRSTGHIPKLYNSLWSGKIESYTYPHLLQQHTIAKVERFYKVALDHCPVLEDSKYNSPVKIEWRPETRKDGYGHGSYSSATLRIAEDGETFYGGPSRDFSSLLVFDPRIDRAQEQFIHEWGHHVQAAMDYNLGRVSYSSKIFAESFAETVNTVCNNNILDDNKFVASAYQMTFEKYYDMRFNRYVNRPTDVSILSPYSLESIRDCIVHERYHRTYNSNEFMSSILEAYRRVRGRKIQNPPYPLKVADGTVGAQWVSGSYDSIPKERYLPENQPMVATRSEFLTRFLEVYDCGKANALIEAEAEGLWEIEW